MTLVVNFPKAMVVIFSNLLSLPRIHPKTCFAPVSEKVTDGFASVDIRFLHNELLPSFPLEEATIRQDEGVHKIRKYYIYRLSYQIMRLSESF
jgi:hypothetical protein